LSLTKTLAVAAREYVWLWDHRHGEQKGNRAIRLRDKCRVGLG